MYTQWRLCPVWSESSLSTWRKLGSSATHGTHCEDSDQTGRMPRLIRVFAGQTCHFVQLQRISQITAISTTFCRVKSYKVITGQHCQRCHLLVCCIGMVAAVANHKTKMAHDKTNKIMCAQRRLRSACTSAQSNQSSLSAGRKSVSLATHKAHSNDWSDWANESSLRRVHMSLCCFFRASAQIIHWSRLWSV